MGRVDTDRQALNVARMRLLGSDVIAVDNGSATLRATPSTSAARPGDQCPQHLLLLRHRRRTAPVPAMVRDLQRIVGLEARVQILEQAGRLPDAVVACVGGGSNAIGIFHPFIDDAGVRLVG